MSDIFTSLGDQIRREVFEWIDQETIASLSEASVNAIDSVFDEPEGAWSEDVGDVAPSVGLLDAIGSIIGHHIPIHLAGKKFGAEFSPKEKKTVETQTKPRTPAYKPQIQLPLGAKYADLTNNFRGPLEESRKFIEGVAQVFGTLDSSGLLRKARTAAQKAAVVEMQTTIQKARSLTWGGLPFDNFVDVAHILDATITDLQRRRDESNAYLHLLDGLWDTLIKAWDPGSQIGNAVRRAGRSNMIAAVRALIAERDALMAEVSALESQLVMEKLARQSATTTAP